MTQKPPFLLALSRGPMVFDGAFGTQLYDRGIHINRSFDDANLTRPDLVRQIHRDYIDHGAQVITTNTFSANAIKLARHSLQDQVEAINQAGCRIAIEAAAGRAFVAGSIGPTGLTPPMLTDAELQEVRQAFLTQIRLMHHEGVDLLCFETFRLVSEIRLALEAARTVAQEVGQTLPIVAQMAFDSEHRTGDGADPKRVVLLLKEWGADVVGANCLEGPHILFEVVQEMVGHGTPVIAQPNAGYPRRVADRLVYMANPEYFGVFARRFFKAGVAIVGGCCGTSPAHTERIAAAAKMMGGDPSRSPITLATPIRTQELPTLPPFQGDPVSGLARKIERVWRTRVLSENPVPLTQENFVVSVEVNPPKGLDPGKALEAAAMLIAGGVDVINIADGPRASVRMSNWALAKMLQETLEIETILHVCARDRNLLGLQADLLAYHTLGLNNLVMITGDPPKIGDYPHATAVFDLDSIGLLRMAQGFNQGIDPSGKPMRQTTSLFCACGAEPAALDYDRELRRLEQKRDAGAQVIMTQPVYDAKVLAKFLQDTAPLGLPVLVGLLPLASWKNAEFLHHEVPGMAVPAHVRDRMREASDLGAQQGREMGVRIAQEALLAVADKVVGAYIMPPFGRYETALDLLAGIDGYPKDP